MSIFMQSTVLLIHLRRTLQQLKKETITKERKLTFCSIYSSRQKKIDSFLSAILKQAHSLKSSKIHQKIILICSATTTTNSCCRERNERKSKVIVHKSKRLTACLTLECDLYSSCVRNYPNMCVNICLFSFSLITAAAQYFSYLLLEFSLF